MCEEVDHGVDVLQGEIRRSRVYTLETTCRLADIAGDLLRLCVAMTDTLLVAFGTESKLYPPSATSSTLSHCEARLTQWHSQALTVQANNEQSETEPATFYRNITMINYQ